MKTSASIAALAGLISTASANYFSLLAIHSGSPIHLRPVEARNGTLYVGGATSAYCPPGTSDCPAGKITTFSLSDGSLDLGVSNPCGQQVYVYEDQISLTIPCSDARLEDAVYDGWSCANDRVDYKAGLIACPVAHVQDSYEIFADVKGYAFSDKCLKLDLMKSEYFTKPTAYEYD